MSDNELEKYLKTIEPNFDSHIEKGTIEMSNEYYNLLEERMIRLLNENKQLKSILNELEEYIKNHYIVGHTIQNSSLDDIINKLNELKEKYK